ncbi:MAG: hypothetical protein IH831_07185 [Planctomycetes bacterium]|nr:hypothetical protein [Planctomycetota bacterium]
MNQPLSWNVITEDNRLGSCPRLVLHPANRPLMQIPDEIRKCVAFVAYEKPVRASAERVICGTGFVTGVRIEGEEDRVAFFFVTAKHIIDKAEKNGTGKTYLRFNNKSGGFLWVDVLKQAWIRHPDSAVDVVVAPLPSHQDFDILFYPKDDFATEEVLLKNAIGIGDDLFVVGLFKMHAGESKNIPIVRAGNIAAMPEEPIRTTEYGMMEAYLVESRSIGGLSGSPVFVYLGNSRTIGSNVRLGTGLRFVLLGLIHGHWNWPTSDIEADALFLEEKLNVGISIVVPAQRIIEVLELPQIKEYLAGLSEIILAERDKNLPVAD